MKNYQTPWLAVSILAFSFAGCAGLNDARYESTQKFRAVREYVKCGNAQCERFPHDYRLGWIDGFYNIATGGPTCPPAVAPQRYWNPKQVLKDCDNRRHAYYSGWQDGASRATQFPDTHHLKIFETCECPMPRCESACGTGGCVPCGLGSVGSPVHEELIEMPYQEEMELPTPAVPSAPVSTNDVGDSDTQYVASDDDAADNDTGSATLTAAKSEQRVVATELEMLETETIQAEQLDPKARQELVSKSDASSIFGSAFDVIRNDSSPVQLQEQDPLDALMDMTKATTEDSPSKASPETLTTETIAATPSKPQIIVPSPTIRKVEEVAKDANKSPTEGTVRLVEQNIIPPAIKVASKQVISKSKPSETPAPELKQVTAKKEIQQNADRPTKATRHPAVAKETIPVRFEMIESDINGKPATVVQAK